MARCHTYFFINIVAFHYNSQKDGNVKPWINTPDNCRRPPRPYHQQLIFSLCKHCCYKLFDFTEGCWDFRMRKMNIKINFSFIIFFKVEVKDRRSNKIVSNALSKAKEDWNKNGKNYLNWSLFKRVIYSFLLSFSFPFLPTIRNENFLEKLDFLCFPHALSSV